MWHPSVDTGGKFATGVSTTTVANENLQKDVTTGVNDTGVVDSVANLPPGLLMPVVCTLACKYLREFLKKILNDPNVMIRGLGEDEL